MYRPDFPQKENQDFQRSRIRIGDDRNHNWETTYQTATKVNKTDHQNQMVNTAMLQRTHWTSGNMPFEMQSVAHSEFVPLPAATRSPARSRDDMMKTSFLNPNPEPMESRRAASAIASTAQKTPNYRDFMVSSHFQVTDNQYTNWETSNSAAYKPKTPVANKIDQLELRSGFGAKASMANMSAFSPETSESRDSYLPPTRSRGVPPPPKAFINDQTVEFTQTTTQKWQKTNWKTGDNKFTTPQKSSRRPVTAIDNDIAKQRKQALTMSSINKDKAFPVVTVSTAHEGMRPSTGHEIRKPADTSVYKSNQHFNDWPAEKETTNQRYFIKHPQSTVQSIDTHLQDTHAVFGHDNIKEMTSLYKDSYQKPPRTLEQADYQAARDFHQGHHSRMTNSNVQFGTSTNKSEFVEHKNTRPSEMCSAIRGGVNIVHKEPLFAIPQSSMKSDYPPKKAEAVNQVDNSLQQSHIHLSSGNSEWRTTQGDYFKFQTYRTKDRPY